MARSHSASAVIDLPASASTSISMLCAARVSDTCVAAQVHHRFDRGVTPAAVVAALGRSATGPSAVFGGGRIAHEKLNILARADRISEADAFATSAARGPGPRGRAASDAGAAPDPQPRPAGQLA